MPWRRSTPFRCRRGRARRLLRSRRAKACCRRAPMPQPGVLLQLTGARLRRIDAAALLALGIERVPIREPRVRVVRAGAGAIDRRRRGADRQRDRSRGRRRHRDAVAEPRARSRAASTKAPTPSSRSAAPAAGRNDESVRTLARAGKVAFHGIGISPGETAAFGYRRRAAGAAAAGPDRRGARRLAHRRPPHAGAARVPADRGAAVHRRAVRARSPRRSGLPKSCRCAAAACGSSRWRRGYLPLQALARADGWILVPADSEGYPAGTQVAVRPWP